MDRTAADTHVANGWTGNPVRRTPIAIGPDGLTRSGGAARYPWTVRPRTHILGKGGSAVEKMYLNGLFCLTQVGLGDLLYCVEMREKLATSGWRNAALRSQNPLVVQRPGSQG